MGAGSPWKLAHFVLSYWVGIPFNHLCVWILCIDNLQLCGQITITHFWCWKATTHTALTFSTPSTPSHHPHHSLMWSCSMCLLVWEATWKYLPVILGVLKIDSTGNQCKHLPHTADGVPCGCGLSHLVGSQSVFSFTLLAVCSCTE